MTDRTRYCPWCAQELDHSPSRKNIVECPQHGALAVTVTELNKS